MSGAFVWNNIVSLGHKPALHNPILARKVYDHRYELKTLRTLVFSYKLRLDAAALPELFSAVAQHLCRLELKGWYLPLENISNHLSLLNYRLLTHLNLMGHDSSLVGGLISRPLPNLKVLAVSDDTTILIQPDEQSPIKLERILALLDLIAINTGALAVFKVAVDNHGIRMSRVFESIRKVVAANPLLSTLDYARLRDRFHIASLYPSDFTTLLDLNGLFQGACCNHRLWPSLPSHVERNFGVRIDRFRVAGHYLCEHIAGQMIETSLSQMSAASWQVLWHANFPGEFRDLSSFAFLFEEGVADRLEMLSPELKPFETIEWMLSEIHRFDDFLARPLKPYARSLLGLINFFTNLRLDPSIFCHRLLEIASRHAPSCPLAAIAGSARFTEDLPELMTHMYNRVVKELVKSARLSNLPIHLETDIGDSTPLLWHFFVHAPEALLEILKDGEISSINDIALLLDLLGDMQWPDAVLTVHVELLSFAIPKIRAGDFAHQPKGAIVAYLKSFHVVSHYCGFMTEPFVASDLFDVEVLDGLILSAEIVSVFEEIWGRSQHLAHGRSFEELIDLTWQRIALASSNASNTLDCAFFLDRKSPCPPELKNQVFKGV
jgi:hypothetical protein